MMNNLKNELDSQGSPIKILNLSLEILNVFTIGYSQENKGHHNPFELIKGILEKFIYLQDERLMQELLELFPQEKKELKNIPVLFLLKKICAHYKFNEENNKENLLSFKINIQELNKTIVELYEKNELLKESMKNSEREILKKNEEELLKLQLTVKILTFL